MFIVVLMHRMNSGRDPVSLTHSLQVGITFPALDPHVDLLAWRGRAHVWMWHIDTANSSSLCVSSARVTQIIKP